MQSSASLAYFVMCALKHLCRAGFLASCLDDRAIPNGEVGRMATSGNPSEPMKTAFSFRKRPPETGWVALRHLAV